MKQFIIFVLLLGLASSLLLHSQAVKITTDNAIKVGLNHALVFGDGEEVTYGSSHLKYDWDWDIRYKYDGLLFAKKSFIIRPFPPPLGTMLLYNDVHTLFLSDNVGRVGIHTTHPQATLHVAGDILYNGSCTQTSDINLKQNILPLKSNLSDLLSLNTITYNRKHIISTEEELLNGLKKEELSESKYQTILANIEYQKQEALKDKQTHYGFIAQEVREIYPELVYEDEEGYLSLNYIEMIPILVNAIKELNNKVDILENNNKELLRNAAQNITTSAMLYQNNPNPFSEQTEIKYYIPSVAISATLCVYDLNGSQILKMDIAGRENGSISINANQLKAGMYLYALLVDGKEVDTKKMILTGE